MQVHSPKHRIKEEEDETSGEKQKDLKDTNMDSGAIAYIRQHKALGLGHAVWCARRLIGNEPFAVILPDDVIAAEKPCLQQMVEAYAETGGSMVAAMEVPPEKASSYGVLEVSEDMGDMVKVKLIGIDDRGKIKLSMKAVDQKTGKEISK